jgi:hypothetical protein
MGVVGDWRLRLGLKSEQSTTIECTFSRNDLCQFVCCVGSQNRIVLTLDGLDRLRMVMKNQSLYASTRFVDLFVS